MLSKRGNWRIEKYIEKKNWIGKYGIDQRENSWNGKEYQSENADGVGDRDVLFISC